MKKEYSLKPAIISNKNGKLSPITHIDSVISHKYNQPLKDLINDTNNELNKLKSYTSHWVTVTYNSDNIQKIQNKLYR